MTTQKDATSNVRSKCAVFAWPSLCKRRFVISLDRLRFGSNEERRWLFEELTQSRVSPSTKIKTIAGGGWGGRRVWVERWRRPWFVADRATLPPKWLQPPSNVADS